MLSQTNNEDIKSISKDNLLTIRVNTLRIGTYLATIPLYLYNCINAIETVLNKKYAHVISDVTEGDNIYCFGECNEEFFIVLRNIYENINELLTEIYTNDEAYEQILNELINIRFEYKFQAIGAFADSLMHPKDAENKIKWVGELIDQVVDSKLDPNLSILDMIDSYGNVDDFVNDYPCYEDNYQLLASLFDDAAKEGYKVKLTYKAFKGLIDSTNKINKSINELIILNRPIARQLTRKALGSTSLYNEENVVNIADASIYNAALRYSRTEFQFTTTFARRIQDEISRYSFDSPGNVIHIPDSAIRRNRVIEKFTTQFKEDEGREPTKDELKAAFPRYRDVTTFNGHLFVNLYSPSEPASEGIKESEFAFEDEVEYTSIIAVEKSIIVDEIKNLISEALKLIHERYGEKMVNFIHAFKIQELSRNSIMTRFNLSADVYRSMRNSADSILAEAFEVVGIDASDMAAFNAR